MRTLGLIGGMSWESTVEYYRKINELVNKKLGGWNSAKLLLYSLNFEQIVKFQKEFKWSELTKILVDAAVKLEKCGAEAILICTNTMHKVAPDVKREINVPIIDIVEVTAKKIRNSGLKRVGLLGTKFTMEDGFYHYRLKKYGIDTLTPDSVDREIVNDIIYEELCKGIRSEKSKRTILRVIEKLKQKGAGGIVLGCTELPLLVNEGDSDITIFDTTKIHCEEAVKFILGES